METQRVASKKPMMNVLSGIKANQIVLLSIVVGAIVNDYGTKTLQHSWRRNESLNC